MESTLRQVCQVRQGRSGGDRLSFMVQVCGSASMKQHPPQAALHRGILCLWDRTPWQMLQPAQPQPLCMWAWAARTAMLSP